MKRIIILFAMVALVACFGPQKSQSFDEKDTIIIAMDLSFPPFEGINPEGKPYGISVDMAQALGEALGKQVEIINVKWDGLIPGLRSGQYDLILSSMSITPERETVVDFSLPYGQMGINFITRPDFALTDLQELNSADVRLAVRKGTIGETLALEMFQNANMISLGDFESAVLEVIQNKADVALADPLTVYQYEQKYAGKLKAVYETIGSKPMAIAMSKNADPKLKDAVNTFLKEYIEKGSLQGLADQYLKGIKDDFAKQNKPFFLF